ncbi:RNA cytosine-C(5)-methyltransferase NSUN2-like isoform X2 [Corticium candelabrum]|uniref:RNA cytosine-C(5)-methyltransferase NSUN2-like isoform X2 n=1 Tax=Corticium candelabrum TaxID=121492 RepID=UPI002E2566C0|nr:RNA cytosine-C(5)-methyltransferase NSUN2-like isoform X2 [Corticium candelabrum]
MPKRKKGKIDEGGDRKRKRGRKKERGNANYSLVEKRNTAFERFYKEQHIVPEGEWDEFMLALRENLAATFRITGTRSHARQVSRCLETIFFKEMEGLVVDGEVISPPHALSWYPDGLAWHVSLPRKVLRKHPTLVKFHQFLVHETEKGNLSRQEAVSMIPPLLLDVKPHHKILDMCAAPGSKTAQLLELLHAEDTAVSAIPSGFIIANDRDYKRCYILLHQLKRINSPCLMVTNHDASIYPTLYHNPKDCGIRQPVVYDRVLCDVPCSGDGTMRKNLIMWKKWNPTLGPGLHRVQLRILCRGIEVLAPGGRLVYSTCSLNPVEDEAVVAALLNMSKGTVELVDVSGDLPGLKTCCGLHRWKLLSKRGEWFDSHDKVPEALKQGLCATMFPSSPEAAELMHLERCQRILPHHQNTGGFFIAVFHKLTSVPWQRKFPLIKKVGHQDLLSECSSRKGGSGLNVLSTPSDYVAASVSCGASDDNCSGLAGEICTEDANVDSVCGASTLQATTDLEVVRDSFTKAKEGEDDAIVMASGRMEDGSIPHDTSTADTSCNISDMPPEIKNVSDVVEGVEKKEEPFIFLTKDDPDWPCLRDYYGLENLPVGLLLVRSQTTKKRKIYIVSQAVKDLVLNQKQHVRSTLVYEYFKGQKGET